MSSQICKRIGVVSIVVGFLFSMVVKAQDSAAPIGEYAKIVVEAPHVSEVALAPDGKFVVYVVGTRSVKENRLVTELLLQPIAGEGVVEPAIKITEAANPRREFYFDVRWCPDGRSFTYNSAGGDQSSAFPAGTLLRYDVATKVAKPIAVNDTETKRGDRPKITALGSDFKWSPSGRMIAFTAALGKPGRLAPTIGVPVTPAITQLNMGISFATRPARGLFVLDSIFGRLVQLTDTDIHVTGFDWAPDEQSLAVVTRTFDRSVGPSANYGRENIVIVDRNTRQVRSLVTSPGNHSGPVWSPDGKWIALTTDFGKSNQSGGLAVVPARGGEPIGFEVDDPEDAQGVGGVSWLPDSSGFYFTLNFYHMTIRLNRADLRTRRITSLPVEEGTSTQSLSMSRDSRLVAFRRSSLIAPSEVYLQSLPDGGVRQVTRLSPDFPLRSKIDVEVVKWASREGKFDIPALLLRSVEAKTKREKQATVVFVRGGPGMVRAGFSLAGTNPELLTLAARGYAVLIPNTRGRAGYGQAFSSKTLDGKPGVYTRLAYEDILAGIDHLVENGVAEPSKLGIYGHSYGGYITNYTVTQTNRFRAAVDYETAAAGVRFVSNMMAVLPGTVISKTNVEGMGFSNPFAPEDMSRLIAESPAFNMHRVSTPMLLLYGEKNRAQDNGVPVYSALQRFGIPNEFILYDEGHVIELPTAQIDYVTRIGDWFDYWVRDMRYPAPELQKQYDRWKQKYESRYGNGKSTTAAASSSAKSKQK